MDLHCYIKGKRDLLYQIVLFSRWYNKNGELTPTEVAEQIAKTSLNGIRK